jgi:hypothetical protein
MVSPLRLNLLRVVYFLIFLFTATQFWPLILTRKTPPTLMTGVSWCFFAALGLLTLVAVFRPLKMLPVMLFELAWKAIWTFGIGLPLWFSGHQTPELWESIKACGLGVLICPIVIPWRHVLETYVKAPVERWR